MKYRQRMTPLWNQLKSGKTREERQFNNNLIKTSRRGDYLIKSCNKSICLAGIGYVDYSYRADGSVPWSKRKNAQWFSKEEAIELTKSWKGVKIVKR
jgi:hypothetical protein